MRRSVTYTYTGNFQTFTVPENITSIDVIVAGSMGAPEYGGGNLLGVGGSGGVVNCTIPVTPNQVLYVYVGQRNTSQDGNVLKQVIYNASDIRTNNNGVTDTTSLNSRIVVAGGGGNGGRCYNANIGGNGGAGGGLTGGSGTGSGRGNGGAGGTQAAGGSGGSGVSGWGSSGGFGLGGAPANTWSGSLTGGAGGAGWYGGGGGGESTDDSPYDCGGGGGGSSYTDSSCSNVYHTQGGNAGDGYVIIYYDDGIYNNLPELYVGEDRINAVSCGTDRIRQIYKGSELVWYTYGLNEIVYSSGSPQSSSLSIRTNGLYKVTVIGGGGGGSNNFGGAGAGVIAYLRLQRGVYTYTIGSGGRGASAYVRNNDGSSGTLSSFTGSGVNIVANGGIRRQGRRNGGGGGTTGVLSYSVSVENEIISRTTDGAGTPYSVLGSNYAYAGSGGQPQGNDEGAGYAGKNGYFELVFISE